MVDPTIEGERVREFRERLKLNQKQLAGRAGLSQQLISLFERTARYNAKLETAQKLASALGVTVADLGREAPPTDAISSHQEVRQRGNVGADIAIRWVPVYAPDHTGQFRDEGTLLPVGAHLLHGAERVIAVKVKTDELSAFVQRGEFAIIDREAPWSDGRIHLFEFEGERLLRQARVKANVVHILEPKSRPDEEDRVAAIVPMNRLRLLGVAIVFDPGGSRVAP